MPLKAGIGIITEDRRWNSIFGCLSIKDNVECFHYNKFLKAELCWSHPSINKVVDNNNISVYSIDPQYEKNISEIFPERKPWRSSFPHLLAKELVMPSDYGRKPQKRYWYRGEAWILQSWKSWQNRARPSLWFLRKCRTFGHDEPYLRNV